MPTFATSCAKQTAGKGIVRNLPCWASKLANCNNPKMELDKRDANLRNKYI